MGKGWKILLWEDMLNLRSVGTQVEIRSLEHWQFSVGSKGLQVVLKAMNLCKITQCLSVDRGPGLRLGHTNVIWSRAGLVRRDPRDQ